MLITASRCIITLESKHSIISSLSLSSSIRWRQIYSLSEFLTSNWAVRKAARFGSRKEENINVLALITVVTYFNFNYSICHLIVRRWLSYLDIRHISTPNIYDTVSKTTFIVIVTSSNRRCSSSSSCTWVPQVERTHILIYFYIIKEPSLINELEKTKSFKNVSGNR